MFESLLQRRRPVSRVALSAAILVLSQSSYVTSASAQTLSPQVLNALKQAPKWMPPTYNSLIGVGIPNTLSQVLQVGLVIPQTETDLDSSGVVESYQPGGATITGTNAFFQPLGTNGRTCATCHQPSNAMGMSTASIKARLLTTLGTDPLFAPVDGANCPNTGGLPLLNQSGYSLLLNYGLIRIPLPGSDRCRVHHLGGERSDGLQHQQGLQPGSRPNQRHNGPDHLDLSSPADGGESAVQGAERCRHRRCASGRSGDRRSNHEGPSHRPLPQRKHHGRWT